MTFKELVDLEYAGWKKRMAIETEGIYILIYLLIGFSVVVNCLWGFGFDTRDILFVMLYVLFSYYFYTMFLFSVKENGKRVNIFYKYVYTPVDMQLLLKAKIIALVKILGAFIVLGQVAAIVTCFIDPDKTGVKISDISVWVPMITGALYIAIQYIYYRICIKILVANKSI